MSPGTCIRGSVLFFTAVLLAGCGGHAAKAPDTILSGDPQNVSFSTVRHAVDNVYAQEPGVGSFTVRSVDYTPAARDQVLAVCRRGGASTTAQERETSRVSACAPLIFFYYEYGRRKAAPLSLDLARKLYWYAASNITGPFEARGALTALLSGWGVK
jgi:hypothetical protein